MPTRNVNMTPQMDSYVDEKIRNGQYANASEVLRASLRALEHAELEDEAKLHALRSALQLGEESGIAEGAVVEEVRNRIRSRAALAVRP